MRVDARRLAALLLAVVGFALVACTGETACIPLEGSSADPCEGNGSFSELGIFAFLSEEPAPLVSFLGGDNMYRSHIVLRGQPTPGTVRCTNQKTIRHHPHIRWEDRTVESGLGLLKCYADIRVLHYIVGSGPSTLTAVVAEADHMDSSITEQAAYEMTRVSECRLGIQPFGHFTGVESIMFLGPGKDASTETWQVFAAWDLERQEDGTVIAVHPGRHHWQDEEDYETEYRPKVEVSLARFATVVKRAQRNRMDFLDGRLNGEDGSPRVIMDAAKLRQFYVDSGAVNHPDGPPGQPPPPPDEPEYTHCGGPGWLDIPEWQKQIR